MDGRSDPGRSSSGRQNPLQRLERGGGAVWAFKEGAGSLFALQHVGVRKGSAEIRGHIHPESLVFEDRPVPVDELARLGWRYVEGEGWERRWVLRSDLDRADLQRDANATIALLAALQDTDPGSFALVYRPPGEEDAGFAQVGCLLAAVSVVVGEVLGMIVTVARSEPIPLLEVAVFAATVGFLVGFLALGVVVPRALAVSAALRGRAADVTVGLTLVIPGGIVLSVWLLAPRFAPIDGDLLLIVAGALIVAVLIWGFIPMARQLSRGQRTRR
jgi:hypothetical protein